VQAALARTEQARGALYPAFSLDGDVHGGAPQKYASSDAFVRVLGRAPLYEGGELRAGRDRSDAEARMLQAGYRVAVREVDWAVRTDYDLVLRAEEGLASRRRGIDRLRAYLTVVESRAASGQGVGADLLRTRQRLASAEADVASLTRQLHEARMSLNDLLGRDPEAPLELASLPDPTPPADTAGRPWLSTPDVARSQSDIDAARAGVRAAQAGRKLHVDLEADAGVQPVLNSDVALLNNGEGWGSELTLFFSLPFWDGGVHRGRMAEANAQLEQAHQKETVVRRAAHLAWARAATELGDLYREYEARDRTAQVARDAYLQAESLYRGGQGRALDVLDAYDAWIQAEQNRLDVVYEYRVAQADLDRWGES
jgi:outer membrane protein TolC